MAAHKNKHRKKKPTGKGSATPLPSEEAILAFLEAHRGPAGKREIIREFHLKGDQRRELKHRLREMRDKGLLGKGRGRRVHLSGELPPVAVLHILAPDAEGDLMARPAEWDPELPMPNIYVLPSTSGGRRNRLPALGEGDRILARLHRVEGQNYEANPIRKLPPVETRIFGVYRIGKGHKAGGPMTGGNKAGGNKAGGDKASGQKAGGAGVLIPTEKGNRREYRIESANAGGAKDGDLVLAEPLPGRRTAHNVRLRQLRVVESYGNVTAPKSISLIAIHEHGLPLEFSPEAEREAKKARPVALGKRTDLRNLPLITIDPEDARDYDDAIWATKDEAPENKGGYRLLIAIADVAHYVRPGSALDREAQTRGNSAYFPDRVVPMLPHALSSDLCSLREGEDRACMAVEITLNAEGEMCGHRFMRGLMRSAARLTYAQVQNARDGRGEPLSRTLMENCITPLYEAYGLLAKARDRRGPLALDLPERRIELDEEGRVRAIRRREPLAAHRLVEAFMIAANVAAAESLAGARSLALYRVHEPPGLDKLESLRGFLKTIGLKLAKAKIMKAADFNHILGKVKGKGHAPSVHEAILRSQSQAYYSPENLHHFGLSLADYVHFTSPIRRYADLLIHRALISLFGFGEDGLGEADGKAFASIAEHISATERRAMAAERDSKDRYVAAYLAESVGAEFEARINGVTRFGFFVTLEETGADGLVPMRSLGDDFYRFNETRMALIGRRWGKIYRLGDPVRVRLVAADPIAGGLRFELAED